MYKEHFRGSWNAPIADSQSDAADYDYVVKGTDVKNPFERPINDAAMMVGQEVGGEFKQQLEATYGVLRTVDINAQIESVKPRKVPLRAAPVRRGSLTRSIDSSNFQHDPSFQYYPSLKHDPSLQHDPSFTLREFDASSMSPNPSLASPYVTSPAPIGTSPLLATSSNDGWDLFKFDDDGDTTPRESVEEIDDESDEEDGDVGDYDETNLGSAIPISFETEDMLRTFLLNPIDSDKLIKCVVMFDSAESAWVMRDGFTGQCLMTAYKRKDGFKRLTAVAHWAIHYATGKAVGNSKNKSRSFKAPKQDESYIAKVKSNATYSHYEIFDSGKNPSKAVGAMEARRELGSVKLEKGHTEKTRVVRACIPALGQHCRPQSKKELMFERHAAGDPSVLGFENYLPGTSLLPVLMDFNGMARCNSIKNCMLNIPDTAESLFVLGKSSKNVYTCYFKSPMAPVMAFALSLINIHGKVTSPS